LLPTSFAELVLIASVAFWLLFALRACWYVLRRKRRALNALACGGLSAGAFSVTLVALFYVLWGINYFRAPLIERAEWQSYDKPPDSREAQAEELEKLCEALVNAANDEYVRSFGTNDIGLPSAPLADMSAIDADIERAFEKVQTDLGLEESFAAPRSRAKPVAASAIMDYLHRAGFYFPWTGEANYNRLQPACVLPHVIAHEKAHQRCVTSEDEANFIGFAACVRAENPYVRYSGYFFAQRQLLVEFFQLNPVRTRELVQRRHPGVQRDVDELRAYWARLETGVAGTVGEVSTVVNDVYLKTNQVKGGVLSYRMSSKLLIVYYRKWKP
jgi:hypothetical protein